MFVKTFKIKLNGYFFGVENFDQIQKVIGVGLLFNQFNKTQYLEHKTNKQLKIQ